MATALAGAVVAAAFLLHVALPAPGDRGPAGFTTALVSAAALCLAALFAGRAPSVAWFAATSAAGLPALDVVGVVQASRTTLTPESWHWLPIGAVLALGVAAAVSAEAVGVVAAGYTPGSVPTRRRGLLRATVVALAIVGPILGWAASTYLVAGADVGDPAPLRIAGRVALGFVAIALVVVAGSEALVIARRAWVATAIPAADVAGRAAEPASRSARVGAFLPAVATELRLALGGRRAAEDERARLAAELHASVLPGLRRAAADATQPDVPASVAEGVRAAVADVETLIEARQSIVLEEFGLVAALEWLAERTEQRSPLRVAIDLHGDERDLASIPRPLARAAFRIALLAVDNSLRHAGASEIGLSLTLEGGLGSLRISDNGRGIDPARQRAGGRGLRDMREAARAAGATLAVSDRAPGTVVEFTWPTALIAGDHAVAARRPTASAAEPDRPSS